MNRDKPIGTAELLLVAFFVPFGYIWAVWRVHQTHAGLILLAATSVASVAVSSSVLPEIIGDPESVMLGQASLAPDAALVALLAASYAVPVIIQLYFLRKWSIAWNKKCGVY